MEHSNFTSTSRSRKLEATSISLSMDPSSPEASNQAEMNGIRWKDRPTIQCSLQLKAQKEREKQLSRLTSNWRGIQGIIGAEGQ
ncbi:hypothetical protein ES332_A03G161600v1 [Gossypium tomentosum]|uniref:Uncharacterized protein n=1 Tax=Gossypium tomentosum TaxID=34277 RepID=A0A5D2R8S7_GOSTO|nr:hypothetical protein ES332_A03G161600v1 [Gossypium tomentosum]